MCVDPVDNQLRGRVVGLVSNTAMHEKGDIGMLLWGTVITLQLNVSVFEEYIQLLTVDLPGRGPMGSGGQSKSGSVIVSFKGSSFSGILPMQ